MIDLNELSLTARLTYDPELRNTQNGNTVTTLRLVHNRRVGSGENRKDEAVFIDAEVWGKTAEWCCSNLTKGSRVFVKGPIKQDEWVDKSTNAKRTKLGMIAFTVQVDNPAPKAAEESSPSSAPAPAPSGATGARANSGPMAPTGYGSAPVADDEEIPF